MGGVREVPQLALALRYPPDQRLGTFVAAPAGALELVDAVAVGASSDWLYLAGPTGCGGTPTGLQYVSRARQATWPIATLIPRAQVRR